jgi:hypothetical protein
MSQFKISLKRRYISSGVLLLASVVALTGGAAMNNAWMVTPAPEPGPQLIIDDSIHADFETLSRDTWTLFLEVFKSRSDCFGDVMVKASNDLNNRAGYDPDSATVTVRVPGTKAMLQSALVHEWAHHVEFQCAAHQELRPEFLIAMGLPTDTPWRPSNITENTPASVWAQIPSEHYAETVIELVLGRRQIPTNILVTREEIQALKEWLP